MKEIKPLEQSFQNSEGIYDGLSKACSSYVRGTSARGKTEIQEHWKFLIVSPLTSCAPKQVIWPSPSSKGREVHSTHREAKHVARSNSTSME